jgi:hypothetical protein
MKHKHYDTIIAWANGAEIEMKDALAGTWHDVTTPSWYDSLTYRIKPEPVRDVLRDALIINSLSAGPLLYAAAPSEANVELVFDGTTGKLKGLSFKQPQKPF